MAAQAYEEPIQTHDHMERCLLEFGAVINQVRDRISVVGSPNLIGRDFQVAGDLSLAALFIVGPCMINDSDLTIRDVGLNPWRTAFLSILTELGADIRFVRKRVECGEPLGTLRVRGKRLNKSYKIFLSGQDIPNLIEELPSLAFAVANSNCAMEICGASELCVKERDRIVATVEILRRMGACCGAAC